MQKIRHHRNVHSLPFKKVYVIEHHIMKNTNKKLKKKKPEVKP